MWSPTEESENSIKSEPSTKVGHVELYAQDAEEVQINADSYPQSDGTLTQDTCLIDEDGGVAAPLPISKLPCQPRRKRPHGTADLWQLRLDYLVAYGPHGQDTYCMVCSQVLHETKVSSFRRHIQECHPETTALSQKEREAMAAAWTKDYSSENLHIQDGEIEIYLYIYIYLLLSLMSRWMPNMIILETEMSLPIPKYFTYL